MDCCIIPGCYRMRWLSASMCHIHAGAQQQWLNNIATCNRTNVTDHQEKAPKGTISRQLPRDKCGMNFPSQLQPGPSGLVLPGVNYPVLPQMVPHLGLAGSAGWSFLPSAYMHTAARNQDSYIPSQSVNITTLPHMATCYVPPRQENRYAGTGGDLSVFKLTPAHKGKTTAPGDMDSSNINSQSCQNARSWHAPVAGVSGERCYQDRSAGQQMPPSSEENSRIEGSCQIQQPTQSSPAHAEAFLGQQMQEASPVLHDVLEKSSLDSKHQLETRQGNQSVLDLSSQQQQTGPSNRVGQHPSTQCQGTRNQTGKSRRRKDSDGDVVLLNVEEDTLFVGGDEQSSVARSNGEINENVNSSRSRQSSVSNQEVLRQTTVQEDSDESGDDRIILDLSVVSPELEEHEQETGPIPMEERGHLMAEQTHQEERGSSEQVSQYAVATGQDQRMSTQSTETAEPSEIQVLETVSLSEQQCTSSLDHDATPKTLRQLSAESYYRCGCVKGGCSFRTLLPSQLELHLQENHPYDVTYPCVHCGSQEGGMNSLLNHLEQHLALQYLPLHCFDASCPFVSFSPEEILKHIWQCRPQQASYICWRCSAKFNSLAMFCLHVHLNLLTIITCQLCSARDVDQQSILMHIASSHPDKGRLITRKKILLCRERQVNHWDTADCTAEKLTASERDEVLMLGSAQQGRSVVPQQLLPPDAQERDATGHETQKQMTGTRKKKNTVVSRSKCRLRKRRMIDGKMKKSPTACKSKPVSQKTTAADNAKVLCSNAVTAENNKPSGTNTYHIAARARLATVKSSLPRKQHPVHLSSPKELSERSQLCAGEEPVFPVSTGDVSDSQEEHVQGKTHKEEHLKFASTPARATEGEVDDGMVSEPETQMYSWIDYTYSILETEMLGCSFCSHQSRFMENHVKHVHSSHRIHFKGFACHRCSFISVDQEAEGEHRCGGSHQLRARLRIIHHEDDGAVAPLVNGRRASAVTGPSAIYRQSHLMTRLKRKLSESSLPSKKSRMSSEKVDSVSSPAKKARRSVTDNSSFSPLQKSLSLEISSTPLAEGRVRGVELVCNICGLTGLSRSGMQHHVYSQHADIMACPVCLDILANDCQLQRHLSDMHPDHCSTFENMKSQNYFTQRSAFNGKADALRRKSNVHNGESGQSEKEVSAVGHKQLANDFMEDASAAARHHQTVADTRHNHENELCQNSPGFSNTPHKQFKTELSMCKLCGFSSRNITAVKSHVYSEHPEKMKCVKCGLQVTGDHKLFWHLYRAHPEDKDALYRQLRSLSWIGVPDNTSGQFVCKLCGYSSNQSDAAQAHMYTDHKDRMKCPRCLVELNNDQELYRHVSNEHTSDRDELYAQHCWKRWYKVSRKHREWTASCMSRPTMLHKRSPAKRDFTRHRTTQAEPGAGSENLASTAVSPAPAPSAPAPSAPASSGMLDLATCNPLILSGEITSEEAVISNRCIELSISVPLMTKEQVEALASQEVNENMEFRCPHCTSDFKWRHKFYEHLCFHYHYRCFRCAHCSFHAFCGSSVVNHNKRTHTEEPRILHVPKPSFERRIENKISECSVSVREPHTERRLLAYERARLKKQNQKCQPTERKRLPKKQVSSPLKEKKEAKCQKKKKTGDEKKPCKKGRPRKVLTLQSGTDIDSTSKLFICPYCRRKKMSRRAVEAEIRYHIHYKPYACAYCPFVSGSERCVKRHIMSTHPQENVIVNYEKNEQKEERFEILLSRAVKLSRITAKTGLISSVKKKYKKAGTCKTGGKTNPLPVKRKTNPLPVKRKTNPLPMKRKTNPLPVKRKYVRRRRTSSGEGDVSQSPGEELRKLNQVQARQKTVDIQCAHCSFVSKDRNTMTFHIIKNHQDLLMERLMNTASAHGDTSPWRANLPDDADQQQTSTENATQSVVSPEDAALS